MTETGTTTSGINCYTQQPQTTTFAFPLPPTEPLEYPILFNDSSSSDDNSAVVNGMKGVNIFSALSWLLPVFEHAHFIPPKESRAYQVEAAATAARREKEEAAAAAAAAAQQGSNSNGNDKENGNSSNSSGGVGLEFKLRKQFPDVASALDLLPLFTKFFEEEKKMIPQHSDYYYYVTKFTFPTPRGERSVTRSRVEGDSRARFAKPVHSMSGDYGNSNNSGGGGAQLASQTVTNSTSVFSLLPGHDNFLVHYEQDKLGIGKDMERINNIGAHSGGNGNRSVTVNSPASAFSLFTYVELDCLRFAFAAVKELLEESKTYNLADGSIALLAQRDMKNNNLSSPFCVSAKAAAAAAAAAEDAVIAAAAAAAADTGRPKKASNVIVAPRKELLEERREIAQKRFLKSDLEEECQRRWPHTPVSKSLIILYEEKSEGDLTPEEIKAMGLDEKRISLKSRGRKGQKFFLGIVELPLLNKKGGAARFRAARLWNMKKDAESAAAEAALISLRTFK